MLHGLEIFVASVGHMVVPTSWPLFHDSAITMYSECLMDMIAKILYMAMICEACYDVFDEAKRANRWLVELKSTMNVVWENSSDRIDSSFRKASGNVTSMAAGVSSM